MGLSAKKPNIAMLECRHGLKAFITRKCMRLYALECNAQGCACDDERAWKLCGDWDSLVAGREKGWVPVSLINSNE